jgi:hypothetical protein
LLNEKYWASYNVPAFPEIRKKLGYDDIVTKYKGLFFNNIIFFKERLMSLDMKRMIEEFTLNNM